MKVNPVKCKAIRFARARVKNPLGYSFGDQKFPEASSCKYLGIILRSDLNWVDQVNCTAQNPGRHFTLSCVSSEKEIGIKKLVCTSLLSPMWVCMLRSMQRKDKCVRPSTEERCSVYKSYEGF